MCSSVGTSAIQVTASCCSWLALNTVCDWASPQTRISLTGVALSGPGQHLRLASSACDLWLMA